MLISFVLSMTLCFGSMTLCFGDAQQPRAETPQRLSMAAASDKVTDYVRRQKPDSKIDQSFAVTDLTTDVVWTQLHAQIVKIKTGPVEEAATFVLSGDRIHRIGRAFGGNGVTSIAVGDLAGDKHPVLIYAFAYGSGRHRSEIGILDLQSKELKEMRLAPINFSTDDFALRRVADSGAIQVLVGETIIGHVTAVRKKDALIPEIKLAKELPDAVRKQLYFPREE
jgi:hypothetical protein